MEQLVNEKVDAFWKGIEGGINKRGQVHGLFFRIPTKFDLPASDPCHLFREASKEILVPSLYGRGGSSLGTMVRPFVECKLRHRPIFYRVINAEVRQPKSERGMLRSCIQASRT